MPKWKDVLPLEGKNPGIVRDMNTIVAREAKPVQCGTFYFYNERSEPMGKEIESGVSIRNIPFDGQLGSLEYELKSRGFSIDGKTRERVLLMKNGESATTKSGITIEKEHDWKEGGTVLHIKRLTLNVLHVPKEFRDEKDMVGVCNLQNAGMAVWTEKGGITHGSFKSARGIHLMSMFYQDKTDIVPVAMDNPFGLPISRKADMGEPGMNTFTTHDSSAFGLASVCYSGAIGAPLANFSNKGSDIVHPLLWKSAPPVMTILHLSR